MSQLKLEKQFEFSLMRSFISLFNFLLNVFTECLITVKACIKYEVIQFVVTSKLPTDKVSPFYINKRNRELDTIKDCMAEWFVKTSLSESIKIKINCLQRVELYDKKRQPLFIRISRFVEFPIFKIKMIV